MERHESSRSTEEGSRTKPTNHDELVRLILRRVGPLHELKRDVLAKTGRKYVTRLTIKRAMETAVRYLLSNEVYSPAMDDWAREERTVLERLDSLTENDKDGKRQAGS